MRGRDIKRYSYEFAGLYLIYIPWHFPLHENPNIKGVSLEAEKAFEEQYPAIYEHLLQYKTQLSARNKAETGVRYEWYALQRWGADYKDDFNKEKIIYSNMVMDINCFVFDNKKFFTNQKCFIITGKYLKYLICILNSKVFKFGYTDAFPTLGKDGRELSKIFLEKIPIPIIPEVEQQIFIDLVDKILLLKKENKDTQVLENEINNLVYKLYDLTQEEIKFIQENTKGL